MRKNKRFAALALVTALRSRGRQRAVTTIVDDDTQPTAQRQRR